MSQGLWGFFIAAITCTILNYADDHVTVKRGLFTHDGRVYRLVEVMP